jgi:hypothetical protein
MNCLYVVMCQRTAVVLPTGFNMAGRQLCSPWFPAVLLRTCDPPRHVGSKPNMSGRTASMQCRCRNQELQSNGCLPACMSACLFGHNR